MLSLTVAGTAFAGSATWNLNPTGSFWWMASNWTPATVPNGPNDTATFGVSNITYITNDIGFGVEVNGVVFNAGASAFTISMYNAGSFPQSLTMSGVGIANNSGITQNFVTDNPDSEGSAINFTNSATAGNLTVFTNTDAGALTSFFDTSNAGNATLIADAGLYGGGAIFFYGDSTGGTGRVEVFDSGSLNISGHNAPGVTVGSIEGDGDVLLGANNLTVGSNDHNTTFSGVIQDSGAGGSLTKVGRKRLILANANSYSGGTTIRGGDLFVRNRKGSGTGNGAVQVDVGRLGGGGIIAGPVTVGTGFGSGSVAELSPGDKGVVPGTLTLLSTLTFDSHGVYLFDVNSDEAIADQVIANGVTIRSRTNFFVTELGQGVLKNAELYDAGDGIWSATGSLGIARSAHTATLLLNGKVLVAGGTLSAGVPSELYDPATGIWTATGSLTTARNLHTATLLPDGKVLVAGGDIGGFNTASAELYDPASGIWTPTNPATGTWAATGSLVDARTAHTATVLSDGTVLVAGGFDPYVLSSAELYNPASGTWSATGSLATGRYYDTATLLPDGKVLVAGGTGMSGLDFSLASAELYNPASGTWTATGSLGTGRYYHTASLLPDGKVLVAGGVGFALPIGTVFTVISNTSATPISGTFSNLPDGSTITIGGKSCQVSYSGGDGNDLTLTVQ